MGLYADELAADQVWDSLSLNIVRCFGIRSFTRASLHGHDVAMARYMQVPGHYSPPAERLPPRKMSASPPPSRGGPRYRSYSRSRSRSPGGGGDEGNTTVFVGNLAPDVDDRTLREFFTTWGTVLETKVRLPPAAICRMARRFSKKCVQKLIGTPCTCFPPDYEESVVDHIRPGDRPSTRLRVCEV